MIFMCKLTVECEMRNLECGIKYLVNKIGHKKRAIRESPLQCRRGSLPLRVLSFSDDGDGGGSVNEKFLLYDNVLRGNGRLDFRFRELRGLFRVLLTPHGFYL